ncbi:MAG TPA: PIN domain nuclease [Armatimonadota bacterium]|nr:PIN domain nuclease [Armatimonadota bacterium]
MNLTDTGPLVALLDEDDDYYGVCVAAAGRLPAGALLTTWPCFTEAMYLLGEAGGYRYQDRLWQMRRTGRLIILDLTPAECDRVDAMMSKYRDVPMDLADASLIAVAEMRRFARLFTIDSDFHIYRLSDGSAPELVN